MNLYSSLKSLFPLFVFLLIYIPASKTSAQNQLKIETSEGTKYIPLHMRQGTVYFSAEDFAEALNISTYINGETGKTELKFSSYNLLITEKNPFILLTRKPGGQKYLHQLPTSTYNIGGKIFIPLIYTLDLIKEASGFDMSFIPPDKLAVHGKLLPAQLSDPVYPLKFDITGFSIEEKANGTLIRLKSKKRILSYNSLYKNGNLRFIFRKALVDTSAFNKIVNKGLVHGITSRNLNGDTELVLNVGKDYSASEVLNVEKSNDLLITLHNKKFTAGMDIKKDKWNFDVIVIDPGHGGKDAGAIGVNGVQEKDVNLAVGLKLGSILEKKIPGVKVVYTRSNDTFVELFKRGKIANDNNGKLFISIHCNSAPKKPGNANGFEIYLLRPGRTNEAISIAERENSVIQYEENPERYQKLTDENFILVSMAHSSYMKYSEKFSEILDKQFSAGLEIPSRGVKQAGFYVLVGASMPGVLIETGFLSNKKDAAYLKSKKGQEQIAESIFQSVKKFKAYYEAALKE